MRYIAMGIAALTLFGCGPMQTTTNIVSIGQDHVRIQAYGEDATVIQDAADNACGMYKKRPQPAGWRCLDGYCIGKEFLWACVDP